MKCCSELRCECLFTSARSMSESSACTATGRRNGGASTIALRIAINTSTCEWDTTHESSATLLDRVGIPREQDHDELLRLLVAHLLEGLCCTLEAADDVVKPSSTLVFLHLRSGLLRLLPHLCVRRFFKTLILLYFFMQYTYHEQTLVRR